MRVRSFRNTVLFCFFYFAATKILQSRGKAKGRAFLVGVGLGGREEALSMPYKAPFHLCG